MRKTILLILFSGIFYFSIVETETLVENHSQYSTARVVALSKNTGSNAATLTRANFETHVEDLYSEINLGSYQLDYDVFRLGLLGYYSLQKEGALNNKKLFTIIDFSKPSTEKRFYTIDMASRKVKYHTYVAHGRNTGENMATKFSNTPHSNQSSLGFYVTSETYVGSKGYSLRLDGKEKTFNGNIRSRAVVMHAAKYATEYWIKRYGRLGRSQGCPALPPDVSREVIDMIKGKTAIFTYYPDDHYLNTSRYLKMELLFDQLDEEPIQLSAETSPRV